MSSYRSFAAILLTCGSFFVTGCSLQAAAQQPIAASSDKPALPPPTPTPLVDRSSPEKTLNAFLAAWGSGNMDTALACVDGAKRSRFSNMMARIMSHGNSKWKADDVQVEEQGDTATVTYSLTVSFLGETDGKPVTNETASFLDEVKLKKIGNDWKLVAEKAGELQDRFQESASIYVTFLVYPTFAENSPRGQSLKRAGEAQDAAIASSRAKRVCLDIMTYIFDHKEKMPPKAESYKESVQKAVPNKKTEFTCQLTGVPFTFNKALEGVSYSGIGYVSETVMIYEGKNQKLDYHHRGEAVVGFADGSCRLISPEEAKSLRWKP